AGDDLALAEHEAEGRTALPGGVELAAVGPLPAGVLHGEVVALAGGVASAHDELLDHRLRRRLALGLAVEGGGAVVGQGHGGVVAAGAAGLALGPHRGDDVVHVADLDQGVALPVAALLPA